MVPPEQFLAGWRLFWPRRAQEAIGDNAVIARSVATKQSIPPQLRNGLLRGACHPAALRADRVARNDEDNKKAPAGAFPKIRDEEVISGRWPRPSSW
jgi:hypothetical protein